VIVPSVWLRLAGEAGQRALVILRRPGARLWLALRLTIASALLTVAGVALVALGVVLVMHR
jgi:hypothetical protein